MRSFRSSGGPIEHCGERGARDGEVVVLLSGGALLGASANGRQDDAGDAYRQLITSYGTEERT